MSFIGGTIIFGSFNDTAYSNTMNFVCILLQHISCVSYSCERIPDNQIHNQMSNNS